MGKKEGNVVDPFLKKGRRSTLKRRGLKRDELRESGGPQAFHEEPIFCL